METLDITATFGPIPGDRSTLSKTCRATLDKVYRHPIGHNLEWADMITLLTKLGSVEHKSHNEVVVALGGEHHVIHKPHGKDLGVDEVMTLRHILSRGGWLPTAAGPTPQGSDEIVAPDLMVVVEHREARLYQLDLRSADAAAHVIRPYDPHHLLHNLTHKDQSRERGQRAPEDVGFYERIAHALAAAGRIVVVGHGEGHSNAAHHLIEHLKHHHPDIFQKLNCEVVADLSALTAPQLLVLGRRALSRDVQQPA